MTSREAYILLDNRNGLEELIESYHSLRRVVAADVEVNGPLLGEGRGVDFVLWIHLQVTEEPTEHTIGRPTAEIGLLYTEIDSIS